MNKYFKYAVGLAPEGSSISYEKRPLDFSESHSGLYLTGLEDIQKLIEDDVFADGSCWPLMEESLEAASTLVIKDINKLTSAMRPGHLSDWNAAIGQKRARDILNVDKTFAGLSIIIKNIPDINVELTGIGTLFNRTGEIEIELINEDRELIKAVKIKTSRMSYKANDISIKLPVLNKSVSRYYLLYKTDSILPLDNKLTCGCGRFKPVFNHMSPRFYPSEKGAKAWAACLSIGGFTSVDNNMKNATFSRANYLYGLIPEVKVDFDNSSLFPDKADFLSSSISIALANALRYQAARILIKKMPKPVKANLYNLWNKQMVWQKKYMDLLRFAVNEIKKTKGQ